MTKKTKALAPALPIYQLTVPRDEGEDFPLGGDCPCCPWWKGNQGRGAGEE